MPKTKNTDTRKKRRKELFKNTKGYFGRRKNVYRHAKNAREKALQYAYRDRKQKKREFRKLWVQRINAGARQYGMSYSDFMGKLRDKGADLNRKTLANMAMNDPESFKAVVDQVKK